MSEFALKTTGYLAFLLSRRGGTTPECKVTAVRVEKLGEY
jgi:hypothetical protein